MSVMPHGRQGSAPEHDPEAWPSPLAADALEGDWRAACATLGAAPPAELYEALLAAWREPQRHYHDLRHLGECLALLRRWRHLAERPAEVALALWFHDAVYDPRAADNEERSAGWARSSLEAAGVPPDAVRRVADLVLATRHDAEPSAPGRDAALLLDIDLAVLGSPPGRFAAYDRDVRLEYAHVPEAVWRERRPAVLRGFLDRPRLYLTEPAAALLEAQARANLASALARLAP